MGEKVYIGMSGGVDSAVAVYFLINQGYDVCGVNLVLTGDQNSIETKNAKKTAEFLDIPFKIIDLREEFEKNVINYFTSEYLKGRTPNPCVICNEKIKFGKFLEIAQNDGADLIATGHYAKINKINNRVTLQKTESKKDQSYFLHRLSQEQLSKVIFPINQEKDLIRKIAHENNIPVASNPDSQEICFVDDDYAKFIYETTGKKSVVGDFIDIGGNIIGKHTGIMNYTIGQRKGLGMSFGKPMYVTNIDVDKNRITLGEEGSQLSSTLIAKNMNYMSVEGIEKEIDAKVKIRCQAPLVNARIIPIDEKSIKVEFENPQRAITPGQCAVLYDDDNNVIGGGYID